jgi:HSP20 family protein
MALLPNKQTNTAEDYEGQLAVDVFQDAESVVILAPIAGVKIQDIHVSVTDNVLKIKGQRMVHDPKEKTDYIIQECFWGPFSREIILPGDVDSTKVSAQYKDGILRISIPQKHTKINEQEISITS